MKNIVVIGLGSMGRRRIRLLKELDSTLRIGGIDAQEVRRQEAEKEFGIETYSSIAEAVEKMHPDCAVVSTSPLSHRSIIMELLENKLHVFTELNLVADGYDEMMEKAKQNGLVLFLSSTHVYRADVQYIMDQVSKAPVNYWIHVGQYLPDWHPWEDYRKYFVADKRTNGCREIFAIDMPWVLKAFGEVEDISVASSKLTGLNIDYPDNFIVTLKHKNGSKGVFLCDIVSRRSGRQAEFFNEDLHIEWKGTPDSLMAYNFDSRRMEKVDTYLTATQHLKDYSNPSIIEDAYKDELRTYLGTIAGTAEPKYTFDDDKKTLHVIDWIEGLV